MIHDLSNISYNYFIGWLFFVIENIILPKS